MDRLFSFLKPHQKLLIALSIVNVLLSGMLTIAPLVTKAIVDDVIAKQQLNLLLPYLILLLAVMGEAIVDDVIAKQQLNLLLPYLILLLAVMGARAATTYFYSYGQNKLGQLVMTDVRAALYFANAGWLPDQDR